MKSRANISKLIVSPQKCYKNTKEKVRSPDGADIFDIIARDLQADTLVLYLFLIGLVYVLGTSIDLMKENGFTLEKAILRHKLLRTQMT